MTLRSLRSRLLLGTVLATSLVLAGSALAVYALMRASLIADFDTVLAARARLLTIMVVEGDGFHKLVYDRPQFPEYERSDGSDYFELWRASGQPLLRSPSLGAHDLEHVAGPVGAPRTQAAILPDGRRGRIAGIRFIPRREDGEILPPSPKREMTLVVATGTKSLERNLSLLRWLLAAVSVAAILASAAVLTGVVKHLLRPLDHLARRIAGLEAQDLSARFATGQVPTELVPVAERLDDLLRRLEGAFSREKAFTADVAHELRTPLSGLRTTLEVMLAKPREPERYREALGECLGICRQMQVLVDNLLALAQLEASQMTVVSEPLQLAWLLREAWQPFAARAAAKEVAVEWAVDENQWLETDREKLRIVLRNLFDNAVSYVQQGGHIRIGGFRHGCAGAGSPPAGAGDASGPPGRCGVTVANSGSVLSQARVPLVFDRFWRGDRARSSTGLHCGLGLSLCQKVVGLLGGGVSVVSSEGGEFAITVELPDRGPPALADDWTPPGGAPTLPGPAPEGRVGT